MNVSFPSLIRGCFEVNKSSMFIKYDLILRSISGSLSYTKSQHKNHLFYHCETQKTS